MQTADPRPKFAEHVAVDIGTLTAGVVAATRQFDGSRPWWRGQRNATWSLDTGLHRRGLDTKEVNLNARFRLMARARQQRCPEKTDPFGWLFLMQHYRLPTRLLDWSQAPLVALYFAVEEPDDADAALWALFPTQLNYLEAGTGKICMPGSSLLGRLGVQAFKPDAGQKDERILSVLPEEVDVRQMVQQSAFTIHGRREALDLRDDAHLFLIRIRIPNNAKKGFRQLLALLGMNRATIFPDLENLALELATLDFGDESRFSDLTDAPPVAS